MRNVITFYGVNYSRERNLLRNSMGRRYRFMTCFFCLFVLLVQAINFFQLIGSFRWISLSGQNSNSAWTLLIGAVFSHSTIRSIFVPRIFRQDNYHPTWRISTAGQICAVKIGCMVHRICPMAQYEGPSTDMQKMVLHIRACWLPVLG